MNVKPYIHSLYGYNSPEPFVTGKSDKYFSVYKAVEKNPLGVWEGYQKVAFPG